MADIRKLRIFGAILLVCGWSAGAFAQGTTTGGLAGTINDSTGRVVPGATVTVSGPNLQGTRTITTDDTGTYRFRNLPPGTGYKVVAALSGFRDATQDNIQVFLGQEGTINLTLAPAGVTEQVQVTAAIPLIDITNTNTGTNITADLFSTLPSTRGFQQLTAIAPSVSLEMGDHDRRFENSPAVGASSAPENNYVIDGLSVTDPRYGTSGANLTMNYVQEVQVLTSGYQAEYGRSTGGVINVITKSGGNAFHGNLFNYNRNQDWTPEAERRKNKELVTFADRLASYDVGGSVGGPIARDRVWFFGAYGPVRQTNYLGGVFESGVAINPTVQRQWKRDSHVYAGKVTMTPKSAHTLVVSVFGDPTKRDGWLTDPNADSGAALRLERTGGHNLNVKYNAVLGSKWLLDAAVGRHMQRADLEPGTDVGRNVPRQIDETIGGYQKGGFQRFQTDRATRDAFFVKLTNILSTHEFRYGFDTEINKYDADLHETWYRFFGPAFGFASYIQQRQYSVAGDGTTPNIAWFAQDAWKLMPSLTLNLGLRYEEQWLKSANQVAISGASDADACTANGECRKVDKLRLKNNWAPRLGLSWDPARNGKSKVYGFWGRFFEAIPLDMNIRAINGEKYIITQYVSQNRVTSTTWVNPVASPLSINGPYTVRRVSNLVSVTPLDEDLKSQYEDQFIVGTEYQFDPAWSAGVRFVDRELRRIIEDIGTFTDPTDPTQLTGYVIGNPGEGFFGAPFEKPSRSYRALEFTLTRAFVRNWHLNSSFVYARARGNHEGLYVSGYDQLDPNITALYDIPSFLPNATGRLRADKPYQFKLFGAYMTKFGLTLSEGFLVSAGIPISAQGPEIQNGYGDGTIFLQPRGSQGRTPAFWNFDFHADYRVPFFRTADARSFSIVLDVFNLFNRHQVMEVDQDYIYEGMAGIDPWEAASNLDAFGNPKFNANLPHSTFFNTPILWQSPRSVQIGFKFTF